MKITGVDAFVAKCARARLAIPAGTRTGVARAATKTKAAVVTSARGRGFNNTRGWVSYNLFGTGETTFAVVSLRGARAYWAERGTQPHTVQGKVKPLSTPYGPRWSVKVKGAKPKPFWHEGVAAAAPLVQKEIAGAVGAELGKLFGGR